MNSIKNVRILLMVAMGLLLLSLTALVITWLSRNSIKESWKAEKLRSEALLSEKLLLEKNVEKSGRTFQALNDERALMKEKMDDTVIMFQERINFLQNENSVLANRKKETADLLVAKHGLQHKADSILARFILLQEENHRLTSIFSGIEVRNALLKEELKKALRASLDRSRVQVLKNGTEKLTVKARKAKKLMTSFEVPEDLGDLHCRIFDDEGNVVNVRNEIVAFLVLENTARHYASLTNEVTPSGRRVEMIFIPEKKLKPGVYRLEITSKDLYVGSLEVKLL